ncbi:pituitary tumor-transforming gene 1 protein-interacting protein isoform X2 [Lingula anatina]|uniref:Pituitary tumor-transforming gene 1 protein-interacting protein isoform X2 n=1 Tax=Lingula anatina TaxID=7574 RepID=A0A1S3KEB5_LINAN|nr:pituitary tumor-transforming gene 1 protein-interacting protein isoform X2 [Lingula anatina]|eukprot:XP_013420842.1 pituitary tumor-transforming gene 1 protein-interacting protein isoform X2 [Lingula anatina]
MKIILFVSVFVVLLTLLKAQSTTSTSSSKESTTVTTGSTRAGTSTTTDQSTARTTALPWKERCAQHNGSDCDASGCLNPALQGKCLYCSKDKSCTEYIPGSMGLPNSNCPLNDARWGTCLVNFQALIIAMAVVAGVILITCGCCIYCCCCRGKKGMSKSERKMEAKYEREREERQIKHQEKRKERESKYDDIRKKYGLFKEDTPYQRFDA